jgi:hypothetical protein
VVVASPADAQRAPLLASAADVPPEVEPPSARGIDARCAEGADLLWRGRAPEAEQIARDALARAGTPSGASVPVTPGGTASHALARCHALLGRALLAGGSRDPAVHAEADAALRRAWALAPSADLIDDLVSAHWMGSGSAPLPIPARPLVRASAPERAALALRGGRGVARTLRTTPTAGGPTWSIVQLETERAQDVVAVACRRSGCIAEPLFAAWSSEDPELRSRALARVSVVGFVPTRAGLALVVGADHAVSGQRVPQAGRERGRVARTAWDGSALYVRWLEGGTLAGWNLLTRSRLQMWDRALGDGPPTRHDVRVRWGRQGVVVQPSGRHAARLDRVAGLRDPRALGSDRTWLGGLRPGQLFLPAP